VYEGASSIQKYAQNVHGMLCSKELSGELDQAKLKRNGLREVWLDIVDNNRIDVAFSPPDNSPGDIMVDSESQAFPGAQGLKCEGALPVHECLTSAKLASAENSEIIGREEADQLRFELGSYKFD
jgi:hypothetical protein